MVYVGHNVADIVDTIAPVNPGRAFKVKLVSTRPELRFPWSRCTCQQTVRANLHYRPPLMLPVCSHQSREREGRGYLKL